MPLSTLIMSTMLTSDVLADSKKDRAIRILDKHIKEGGKHGEKSKEIKDKINGVYLSQKFKATAYE
jgi:hypothetical protein